jgi:TonB family protein
MDIEQKGTNLNDLEVTKIESTPALTPTKTDIPSSLDLVKEEVMTFDGTVDTSGNVEAGSVTMSAGDQTVEQTLIKAIEKWTFQAPTSKVPITVTITPSSELSRLLNLIT